MDDLNEFERRQRSFDLSEIRDEPSVLALDSINCSSIANGVD